MNRHMFFAAAMSLAFAAGCGPTAQGGSRSGATVDPLTPGSGGASASERGAADPTGGGGGSMGAGGAGRAPTTQPLTDPTSDVPLPCDVCSAALGGGATEPLCRPSQTAYDSFLACACAGACASVCGTDAGGSCLDGWEGNPPLECKTCLVSATGCGATWDACLADDGVTPPDGASSSSGGSCSCDAALPLCPGGGSCATPGPFDAPGNSACGSAEYCSACCDPGGACASQGTCKVTLSANAPCSLDYECCSGVCTAGQCDGGCGIILSF
jgi:hypothetical protein